jgi:excisionase family DNA binding protein
MSPRDLVNRWRADADRLEELGLMAAATQARRFAGELLQVLGAEDGQPGGVSTLCTVAEVALQLHRSPSTVRGWCEAGRFTGAFKLNGRDWRIPPAAVERFLDAQRPAAPSAADPARATRPRTERGGSVDLAAWRKEAHP